MLKNRIIYLLTLTAELFFFSFYLGSFGWQLLMLTLLLPILSVVLTLMCVRGITADVSAPERVTRGSEITLTVTSQYGGSLPSPPMRVHLTASGQEGRKEKSFIMQLWGNEGGELTLFAPHCGRIVCRMDYIRIYDYLGLFSFRKKLAGESVTSVMPVIGAASQQFSSVMSECCDSSGQGGYSEIYEIREYRPGDSLRAVHWKLSQKADSLLVREFQVSRNAVAVLTLDILPPSEVFDRVLDRLASASTWMLERGLAHMIAWHGGEGVRTAYVADMRELYDALGMLLIVPRSYDLPPMSKEKLSMPVYHFEPEVVSGHE